MAGLEKEAYGIMIKLASGKLTKEELTNWLESNTKKNNLPAPPTVITFI